MSTKRIHHYIDGSSVEGSSGRTGPVWNPATGEQQGEVRAISGGSPCLAHQS